MARNSLYQFVAVLLAVTVPASVMSAETRGAMLYASNSAVLNGATLEGTSSVFAGDKITVPARSGVTLTAEGSSIIVPALSTVTFNGDSVALDHEAAIAITTTKGMAAQIGNVRIAPAKKNEAANFQVGRFDGKIVIAAKQGSVLVASAAGTKLVAEGATTVVSDPEPQKPGAIPATRGGVAMGEIPTWVAILIGLAAAAVAAAIAIATTGKPASPPAP